MSGMRYHLYMLDQDYRIINPNTLGVYLSREKLTSNRRRAFHTRSHNPHR